MKYFKLFEQHLNEAKQGSAVKTVKSAINSGPHINDVSYEEYLLPLAEYLDSYADRDMGDLEFSDKTFKAFAALVDSMNADMKEAEKHQ
jgi:hypothetical protein